MAASLFHFAREAKAIGSLIEPGNFGRIIIETGETHMLFRREMFYESIRQMSFPHRPSRLNCLFCFQTIDEAEQCRTHVKGYADSILHEVETQETEFFVADMNNHLQHYASRPFNPNIAALYWSGWRPFADPKAIILREILLRRAARVVGTIGR